MGTAINRLLWWHWLLIGAGASLILFLILYFAVVRPKTLDTATATTEAQSIEDSGGTPEKVQGKQKELKKAKEDTIRINKDWAMESAVYMPAIQFDKEVLPAYEGLPQRGVYAVNGKYYGVKDLPTVWGRWITAWYESQKRAGITPLTLFPVESFSPDPNDIANLHAIAFPQTKPWDVEVQATNFDAAMNHLQQFNHITRHGMPVVDKVALSGQSPNLRLRYSLQMFIIPPSAPPAIDPKIGGGGGGTAPGGGGGMSPMGGGPGGMSPMGGGPGGGKRGSM